MQNNIHIIGTISAKPVFNHEKANERFYLSEISTKRISGIEDVIKIIIPERIMEISASAEIGNRLDVTGAIRCKRIRDEKGIAHDFIYVLVDSMEYTDSDDINEFSSYGFICTPPTFRTTPNGREISDVCLAIDRNYGKSDYIHCIFWGRSAKYVSSACKVSDKIYASGRLQSRMYTKVIDGKEVDKVVYEVSVVSFDVESECGCNGK